MARNPVVDETISVVKAASYEFYNYDMEQLRDRLIIAGWPPSRSIRRVVPVGEAMQRLLNRNLAILVQHGFVGIVEDNDQRIYPVQIPKVVFGMTFDRMADLDTDIFDRAVHEKKESPVLIPINEEDVVN